MAEAQRFARLLVKGNKLWKVGTIGIIGMCEEIVKVRRRQASRPYSLRASCTIIKMKLCRQMHLQTIDQNRPWIKRPVL